MTPPDSPSALLERAAELIERRAAEALASTDTPIIDGNPPWTDWYLMFEPDEVAHPLVEWLRAEAEYIKGIRSWKYLPGNTRRAVDFARAVLGESP